MVKCERLCVVVRGKGGKSMKVSVIIPAYNIEGYIGKCLDSVLAQDIDQNQLEIILLDILMLI